jgi:hypothetical protein
MQAVKEVRSEMKVTKRLPAIFLAIPFLAVLIVAAPSGAVEQSMLTREVMLEIDADPWAMVAAGGDGSSSMIVAGNSGYDAWGAKFDTRGQKVWDYRLGLQDQFKYPIPVAQFRAAASMPDGSVFLCGSMPRPQGSTASQLMLAHLDANGRPLSETFPTPDSRTNPGVQANGAAACVRCDDGIVVLAEVWRIIRSAGVRPRSERFYWVFAVDPAGKIKWETQIPMLLGNGFDPKMVILASAGPRAIFSASNNEKTEVVTMGEGGAVKSQREIPGRFVLVRPVSVDGTIQLFGTVDNQLQPVVVTLDDQLAEVSRVSGDYPKNFWVSFAYSTPGGSIALFGSTVHGGGAAYTSLVVSVDRALKAGRDLELPHARGPVKDIGFIRAAAPGGRAGEFVVARRILPSGPGDLSEAARPKVTLQLELDYLQFN